jgi:hypothetical protein
MSILSIPVLPAKTAQKPVPTSKKKSVSQIITAVSPSEPSLVEVAPNTFAPSLGITKPVMPAKKAPQSQMTLEETDKLKTKRTSAPARAKLPTPTTQAPPRTVKCIHCHATMAFNATKPTGLSSRKCINRTGCDERKAQKQADEGGKALKAAMTPKESALVALGQGETSNGMRIVTPSTKELKKAGFDPNAPLERVTDEEEVGAHSTGNPQCPAVNGGHCPIEGHNVKALPANQTAQAQSLIWRIVEQFGATWAMRETMMAEGITTLVFRLVALIMENTENGMLTGEGHMAVVAEMAKMAKAQEYKTLAFYLAQAYFNESGVRVPGF